MPFTAMFFLLETLDVLLERPENIIPGVDVLEISDDFTFTGVNSNRSIRKNDVGRMLRIQPFKGLRRDGPELHIK